MENLLLGVKCLMDLMIEIVGPIGWLYEIAIWWAGEWTFGRLDYEIDLGISLELFFIIWAFGLMLDLENLKRLNLNVIGLS